MAKRFPKLPPVNEASFTADSPMTRAVACRLIGPRIRRSDENDRQARNRAQKAFANALKTGRLSPDERGRYRFADVRSWARDTWPDALRDWPRESRASADVQARPATAHGVAATLPGDLRKCHDEIERLWIELERVTCERDALRAEVSELRSHKERAEAQQKKGRHRGKW